MAGTSDRRGYLRFRQTILEQADTHDEVERGKRRDHQRDALPCLLPSLGIRANECFAIDVGTTPYNKMSAALNPDHEGDHKSKTRPTQIRQHCAAGKSEPASLPWISQETTM